MALELNYNLLDFVDSSEKVILNQTIELGGVSRPELQKIMLTNKKFMYATPEKVTSIPLKAIKDVVLYEYYGIFLQINGTNFSFDNEEHAKKMYSEILKNL